MHFGLLRVSGSRAHIGPFGDFVLPGLGLRVARACVSPVYLSLVARDCLRPDFYLWPDARRMVGLRVLLTEVAAWRIMRG